MLNRLRTRASAFLARPQPGTGGPKKAANAKAAYFDFAALCGANAKWSPRDYENLSKAYEFVFLESIPVLDVAMLGEDVVRRFVMVIDALYANKTKLYCSSPSTKSIADLFPQSSSTPSRENSSSSTPTATTTAA